jgi:hypothetical protein
VQPRRPEAGRPIELDQQESRQRHPPSSRAGQSCTHWCDWPFSRYWKDEGGESNRLRANWFLITAMGVVFFGGEVMFDWFSSVFHSISSR